MKQKTKQEQKERDQRIHSLATMKNSVTEPKAGKVREDASIDPGNERTIKEASKLG